MICISIEDCIFNEINEKRQQLNIKILTAEMLLKNIKSNGSKNNRKNTVNAPNIKGTINERISRD